MGFSLGKYISEATCPLSKRKFWISLIPVQMTLMTVTVNKTRRRTELFFCTTRLCWVSICVRVCVNINFSWLLAYDQAWNKLKQRWLLWLLAYDQAWNKLKQRWLLWLLAYDQAWNKLKQRWLLWLLAYDQAWNKLKQRWLLWLLAYDQAWNKLKQRWLNKPFASKLCL